MRMARATRAGAIFALAVGGFAGAAPGAPGDALVVTANQVNVRTEPSTSGRIWVRVDRDEPAIELGREGDWVQVELPRRETTGWIHQSLLSVVATGSAPAAVDDPPAAEDVQVEAPATEALPVADTESEAATTTEPVAASKGAPVDAPVTPTPVPKPDANDGMATAPAEGASETTAMEAAPAEVATEAAVTEAAPAETEAAVTETGPAPAVEAPAPVTEPPTSSVAAVERSDSDAQQDSDPIALERFRTSVTYLNDRALAAAGIDLFSGVEQVGAGTAQVQVTDAWSMMPPSGRQSYLNILYDRWLAATGARGPLSVQIVDPSGQVADQKSGP